MTMAKDLHAGLMKDLGSIDSGAESKVEGDARRHEGIGPQVPLARR